MPIDLRLSDRQFNRLAVASLAFCFLLLVGAFVLAVLEVSGGRRSTELVRHTDQVIEQIGLLDVQLERAESGRRGYLLEPSAFRQGVFETNAELASRTLDRLGELTSDNPAQVRQVTELRRLVDDELAEIRASIRLAASGQVEEAYLLFSAKGDSPVIRTIRRHTAEMRTMENRLHAQRSAAEKKREDTLEWVLASVALLLVLVGAASFWLVRRYTRDLTETRDRLHVLNTDLEGAVAVRTADLRRANDEIQRFAYIVSHDLRSPLVNVMGFTAELETANAAIDGLVGRAAETAPELVTEDVRNARADLPEAIGFIRSSTQKMDRLINAILTLSRQGRRTLTPEKVSMERLIEDTAASLVHRLGEADAKLIVEKPLPDIRSDRLAMEQIFSNLLDNAAKYLSPDRPGRIVVRGRSDGSWLEYEVEDNGRGIDPKDHQRVFDLFRRSGMQDQPGEGIGLAHVRALIHRLGGNIECSSELGAGATFRVRLPNAYRDEGSVE